MKKRGAPKKANPRSCVICTYVTRDERRVIRASAKREKLKTSEFSRRRLLQVDDRQGDKK